MRLQRALRNQLLARFPDNLRREPWCSCGSPNHARAFAFRVDGLPACAIVPESFELTAARLAEALPGAQVEPLAEAELNAFCTTTELGRMQPFENPFGAAVYLDENLAQQESLVFCPRMFGGRQGECFRVPTRDFLQVMQGLVLGLAPTVEEARRG